MKKLTSSNFIISMVGVCCGFCIHTSLAEDHHDHDHSAPQPPAERRTRVSQDQLAKMLSASQPLPDKISPKIDLPPLPDGVEEISFQEFYQLPVGPRGLEPSAKLLSLDGKRVRILGFMGEMRRPDQRNIIFAPMPLKSQPEEYGLCDDIPATHVLVTIPGNPDETIPFSPAPMLLTGVLSLGINSNDSETSFVRMLLTPLENSTH
jgi:hypothetical protein